MTGAGDGGCGLLVSRFKRRSFLVEGCLVVVATAKFIMQEAHACATSNKLLNINLKRKAVRVWEGLVGSVGKFCHRVPSFVRGDSVGLYGNATAKQTHGRHPSPHALKQFINARNVFMFSY